MSSTKTWIHYIALYALVAIFTLVVLVPFYWMFKASISGPSDLNVAPPVYLPTPTLRNFAVLLEQIPYVAYTRNSLVFALGSTLATMIVSYMAAYAFARIEVPGSGALMWLLILSMSLPAISTIVPLYQILVDLRLLDSLAGLTLVLSSALVPFTVWVLVPFIKQVPYEIEEAAIIDGANLLQIFWYVLLPVTAPGLVTMGLINFVNGWNNLLYPLAFASTERSKTLSIAMSQVFSEHSPWGKPWELVSAVGVTMVVPIIILVIFSQRAIVRGLTAGAIK